jgi:hypothetical protein
LRLSSTRPTYPPRISFWIRYCAFAGGDTKLALIAIVKLFRCFCKFCCFPDAVDLTEKSVVQKVEGGNYGDGQYQNKREKKREQVVGGVPETKGFD